jgi:hypothetical protein
MAHGAKGSCWEIRRVKIKRTQGSKLKKAGARKGITSFSPQPTISD